jgi:hypothetical protein
MFVLYAIGTGFCTCLADFEHHFSGFPAGRLVRDLKLLGLVEERYGDDHLALTAVGRVLVPETATSSPAGDPGGDASRAGSTSTVSPVVAASARSSVPAYSRLVFISHSHADNQITTRLADDLRNGGADVWVDTNLLASDAWIGQIRAALTSCDWFLVVVSPAAVRSKWVQAEINIALARSKHGLMRGVIPILVEPCRREDIPVLGTFRWLDATRNYEFAFAQLRNVLSLHEVAAAAPARQVFPALDWPERTYARQPERVRRASRTCAAIADVEQALGELITVMTRGLAVKYSSQPRGKSKQARPGRASKRI